MAKEPRPGMGQEEKDQLGQAAHDAFQRELLLEALAAALPTWVPDEHLEALDAEGLRAEAERRQVQPAKASADTIKRLVARRKEVEAHVRQREAAGAVPPTGQ